MPVHKFVRLPQKSKFNPISEIYRGSAKKCNCHLPCYNAVTEIEKIQQGKYLWHLDGSIDPESKERLKRDKL